jgi:asparagine synthase (glutamine-hydrolysing)
MCGIAGAIHADPDFVRDAVGVMCDRMIARGPDDGGVSLMSAHGVSVALGNRRLAIIDPSSAGHQPMRDEGRGTTIVFNGMIYNHRELRAQLTSQGEAFVSQCDTEVVLKAYGRYGTKCVDHLRGMFAFAVWDPREQALFLARDSFGIKPLYYWHTGGGFMFASQVKALLATGHVPARLSPAGLQTYLSFGAVSEPLTAIDGVFALPAAHAATVRYGRIAIQRYWSPPELTGTHASRQDVAAELRARLEDSVRRHLISDAPLGVFLSGGLDSSVLAALAARESARVRTVSVAFDDAGFSERPHMERVSQHIGSEHVCVTLRPVDLLAAHGEAFEAMDQPTFDGLNTYIVSREAARAGLKVALSGLGADELFDGYGYTSRIAALERAADLPRPLTQVAGRVVAMTRRPGNHEKLAAWLSRAGEGESAYELLRRVFLADEAARLEPEAGAVRRSSPQDALVSPDLFSRVTALELAHYTNNVLLRDTDAMSMAHSLEVRVPYLDRPLVEWVLSLPAEAKGGAGKALLVEAARDLLPPEILTRRKQGFALPLARWMRGEVRDEVDSALRNPPEALAALLDRDACVQVWEQFLRDGRRWTRPWALFALCRWAATINVRERIAA